VGWDPNNLGSMDVAHFYINNDVVSRLGGGHVQKSLSTYSLTSWENYPERELYDENGQLYLQLPAGKKAQSFVDAHRIESGFYRHFNTYRDDFRAADLEAIDPINAATFQQTGASFAGYLSDHSHYSPAEALFRNISAATAILALIPPDHL